MFLLIFADFGTIFADFETQFAYFESQFPKICSRLFNEFKALKSNERSKYGSPVAGWMRSVPSSSVLMSLKIGAFLIKNPRTVMGGDSC